MSIRRKPRRLYLAVGIVSRASSWDAHHPKNQSQCRMNTRSIGCSLNTRSRSERRRSSK
jgi:hypothetical protein